jgi:RimJ/RimL family protein N-acetyltransferase
VPDPVRHPFEGTLVRLRAHEPADLDALNELFIDPDVLLGVGSFFPQAVAGYREFLERARKAGDVVFAIEDLEGRRPIGGCSLFEIRAPTRSATLGIWIGRPHWDRGFGTDAVRTLCRFGFRFMNLHRIELGVFTSNARAVRAYEICGFTTEGVRRHDGFRDGRHTDSLLMSLLEGELRES